MQDEIGERIEVDEEGALRAMFRARKEVFIDLLKWDLPVLANEFEVDQFDTDAEYLILLEEGVRHRASTAHGAGANRTDHVRRGIVIGYCLGWLKPYENQWLAYPPKVARTFSRELSSLAGYTQHRPNLGNYEGQCPSILLGDAVPRHIGAIDALRPDQEAMIAGFSDPAAG